MHFELLLTGKIPSGKGRKHSRDRLALRQQVHEQMQTLWSSKPLKDYDDLLGIAPNQGKAVVERHGKNFITPIRESLWTACKLDVVFYEPADSLRITSDVADPDNRLAGLLDVLSIPVDAEEASNLGDETYVLMEDDKLLWGVSVERRRLLRSIEGKETFCRIFVRVIPTSSTLDSLAVVDIPGH
ncbi:MAG TPA: hypothetical protein VHA07_14370 [Devosia sp.]|nr:hypothetical protein [Devosia sp.]